MKEKFEKDIEAVEKEFQEGIEKAGEEAKSGLGDLEGMAGGRLEEVVQVGRRRAEILKEVRDELRERGEWGDA